MKKLLLLVALGSLILSTSVSAQAVSSDSLNTLKQEKESIEIRKRINDHKTELAKLENSLERKTKESQSANYEAQKSADNNGDAANRLSNDAQDKKLARQANHSAKEAKRDAKQARKATSNLEELRKNIELLKKKIEKDENRLSQLSK